MHHNVNIKIIGDLWDRQEYHDARLNWFKGEFDRLLHKTQNYAHLRGDYNFEYHAETARFKMISITGSGSKTVIYMIEISRDFQKEFF